MQNLRQKAYNLLRWSEQYTKTDMIYLAKGGFWLMLGQIVASVSTFLLAIAFANLLPKEAYGAYKYILALAGTLGIFTLTGMGTAVTQTVARGFERVFMPAVYEKIRWGFIGTLVSLSGALYYYLNDNITLAIGLVIIGIFMPFMEAFGLYDSLWQGKKRFDLSTKYFVIGQLISVAASVGVLLLTENILILTLTYFGSWTILRAVFLKTAHRDLKITNKESGEVIETLSYGRHLSLMGVIGIVANYADRILVFQYIGAAEAAIYAIAIAIPEQIKGMFKNVGNLALPKFSNRDKGEALKSIREKELKMGVVIVIIIGIYILVAPLIFQYVFPQYQEAVHLSQIFSISIIASLSVIPMSFLQSQKRKEELYIINTTTSIIQIILLFGGIYLYGLMGIILARVASRLINLSIYIWFSRSKTLV